jgi:hypothetical protein
MQNNENQSNYDKNPKFIDRSFEEVPGGYWDGNGCYVTPDGSYWDSKGNYFNKDGFDKHGGFYDSFGKYIHGANWNEELQCYDDEIDTLIVFSDYKRIFEEQIGEELIEQGVGYNFENSDEDFLLSPKNEEIENQLNNNILLTENSQPGSNFNSSIRIITPKLPYLSEQINKEENSDGNKFITPNAKKQSVIYSTENKNISSIKFTTPNKSSCFMSSEELREFGLLSERLFRKKK